MASSDAVIQLIESLSAIAKTSLHEVYHNDPLLPNANQTNVSIPSAPAVNKRLDPYATLDKLVLVLGHFVPKSSLGESDDSNRLDITDNDCLTFFRTLLPKFIEIFVKRQHSKVFELKVLSFFIITARFLALPVCLDYIELIELRNFLLLGGTDKYRYVNPKQLLIGSSTVSSQGQSKFNGFFTEFGKPACVIINGITSYFWEDEWEAKVGKEMAIGHYIKVNLNKEWIEGQIDGYCSEDDTYSIMQSVESSNSSNSSNSSSSSSGSGSLSDQVTSVRIRDVVHTWTDIHNRHRLSDTPKNVSTKSIQSSRSSAMNINAANIADFKGEPISTNEKLAYSADDSGKYLMIWWLKYKKYYFGRIVSFDKSLQKHVICYEDGDVRAYDMKSKEFSVIDPPDALKATLLNSKSDAEAAGIVSKWHATAFPLDNNITDVGLEIAEKNSKNVAPRLIANGSYPVSSHLLSIINTYFDSGGADSMSNSMMNEQQEAPIIKALLLHVQLIYSLRIVLKRTALHSLIWSYKECTQFALNRYNNHHFKTLEMSELNELLQTLKEMILLIMTTNTNTNENSNGVLENIFKVGQWIETLRLSTARKLLSCNQLQRRFIGLTIIREVLENITPKISDFCSRRNAILGANSSSSATAGECDRGITSSTREIRFVVNNKGTVSAKEMEQWLLDSQIIDEMFGSGIHQDLIARTDCLIVFLAYNNALNERHIDAIWQAAKGSHEAILKVIYHLFLLITPVLDLHLRMYFFNLIKSVPYSEYNESLLYLIKDFTAQCIIFDKGNTANVVTPADNVGHAISRSSSKAKQINNSAATVSQKKWWGFEVLWCFIQDPLVNSVESSFFLGKSNSDNDNNNSSNNNDSVNIEESVVNLAVTLIVELLKEEFKSDREVVMQKCLDNISSNVSVPSSLLLLRQTLATYQSPPKGWFSSMRGRGNGTNLNATISSQIERLHKQNNLLNIVFKELESYHKNITNVMKSGANNSLESGHIKGVSERLDFLKFILLNSNILLDEKQSTILWQTLGEEAATFETLEKLMNWFDLIVTGSESKMFTVMLSSLRQDSDPADPSAPSKLSTLGVRLNCAKSSSSSSHFESSNETENSLAFEEGILTKLFECHIVPWASYIENLETISNPSIAYILLKLMLMTNVANRAIKVDITDNSWVRVGTLSGMPLLWRLAVDCNDINVSSVAMSLLVELHHRVPDIKGSSSIREIFLKIVFRQLYVTIQSISLNDISAGNGDVGNNDGRNTPSTNRASQNRQSHAMSSDSAEHLAFSIAASSRAVSPESTTKQKTKKTGVLSNDEWFEDGAILLDASILKQRLRRLILIIHLFTQRFYQSPSRLVTIKVLSGKDETPITTFTLKYTETLAVLRQKIASYVREKKEMISIYKINRNSGFLFSGSGIEILEKEDMTFKALKFLSLETVYVQKKEQAFGPASSTAANTSTTNAGDNKQANGDAVATDAEELTGHNDLRKDQLNVLKPMQWLNVNTMTSTTRRVLHDDFNDDNDDNEPTAPKFFMPPILFDYYPYRICDLKAIIRGKHLSNSANSNTNQIGNNTKSGSVGMSSNSSDIQDSTIASKDSMIINIGSYISITPSQLDQLLAMLDGHFATISEDSDLSAIVWDTLQQLPVHAHVVDEVREMPNDSTGRSIRRLLDSSSPYKLLYVLQVIDAFLVIDDSPDVLIISNSGGSGSSNKQSQATSKRLVVDWAIKFLFLGGVEQILQLIAELNSKLGSVDMTASYSSSPSFKAGVGVQSIKVTRSDVNASCASLLYRLLHKFLLLDPSYKIWQEISKSYFTLLSGDPCLSNMVSSIPPGLVLSCLQDDSLTSFAENAIQSILTISDLASKGVISSISHQIFAENCLLVILSLLTAVEDCSPHLRKLDPLLKIFIRQLCTFDMQKNRILKSDVCIGCCKRIFDCCANIWLLCANGTLPQEQKSHRLHLFDYLFYHVATISLPNSSSTRLLVDSSTSDEAYTLTAALYALKSNPDLLFDNRIGIAKKPTQQASSLLSIRCYDEGDKDSGESVEIERVCKELIDRLFSHQSTESFVNPYTDETLLGILRCLLVLASSNYNVMVFMSDYTPLTVNSSNSNLVSFLYGCLYPKVNRKKLRSNSNDDINELGSYKLMGAACYTESTRLIAYGLLYQLCRFNIANIYRITDVVNANFDVNTYSFPYVESMSATTNMQDKQTHLHSNNAVSFPSATLNHLHKWEYDPSSLAKEPDAFVGLVNQGGTCYMNSFLQQLYHVPSFSKGLLSIVPKSSTDCDDINSTAPGSSNLNMLFQLQVLFGYLSYSQKRFYDTLPFCQSFIDYDGNPISLDEQKDINEFAVMLFDKLENGSEECKDLLSSTIRGKLVYKTKSIETSYKSERDESFYMLTAEVKGKERLEDSLELFIAEELFTGDNRLEDPEGRKVDALRQCVIKELPETLLILLKRFEFDLETMERKKVNDYFEFPIELDMYPYTEACHSGGEHTSKRNESFAYTLKGVVAHVGAIDRGHYYSFIKERTSQQWFEFNDRNVLPFTADAIPPECFGGEEMYTNSNGQSKKRARQNSAYMLVYERKPISGGGSKDRVDDSCGDLSLQFGAIDKRKGQAEIHTPVFKDVWTENTDYQIDRCVYDPAHFRFVWQLLSSQSVYDLLTSEAIVANTAYLKRFMHFVMRFNIDILASAKVASITPLFIDRMTEIISMDKTLTCAHYAIEVLSHDYYLETDSFKNSGLQSTPVVKKNKRFSANANELASIQSDSDINIDFPLCHPWLLRLFVLCRNKHVTQSFGKFLLMCLKLLRQDNKSDYLRSVRITTAEELSIGTESYGPPPATRRRSKSDTSIDLSASEQYSTISKDLVNPVAKFVNRLLSICEKYRPEDVTKSEGYRTLTALLLSFTNFGYEEKALMVFLGTTYRLVCSMLILNPSITLVPIEECYNCIEIIGTVMRCCVIGADSPQTPGGRSKTNVCDDIETPIKFDGINKSNYNNDEISPFAHVELKYAIQQITSSTPINKSNTYVPYLQMNDLQAFLNKIFLEDAILINVITMSQALQHVCWCLGGRETLKICDFLCEKVLDCTSFKSTVSMSENSAVANAPNNSGNTVEVFTSLSYRTYFRAISDIILGNAVDVVLVFNNVVPKLIEKANQLTFRQNRNDSEFIYAVNKLLFRIGISSQNGHSCVLHLKDSYKNLMQQFISNSKKKKTNVPSSTTMNIGDSSNMHFPS